MTELKDSLCIVLALQGYSSVNLSIESGAKTEIHNPEGDGNVFEIQSLLEREISRLRHLAGDPIIISPDPEPFNQDDTAPGVILAHMLLGFGFQKETGDDWVKMGKSNSVTASLDHDTSIVLFAINNILNGYYVATVSSIISLPSPVIGNTFS